MAAEEDRVRYFAVLSVGEFLKNKRETYLKVKAGLCLDVIEASTRAEPQSKLQPYIYIRAPGWAVATSEDGDRFRDALFPEDGQLRVVRVNLDAIRPTNKRKMVALDTHDDPPQVWDPEVHGQVALVRPYLVVSRDQDDKVLMVQSVNSPLGQEFHWKVVEHNLFGWTSLSRSARKIIQGLSPDEVYDLRGTLHDALGNPQEGNPDWRTCLWNVRFYRWMKRDLLDRSSAKLCQAILDAIPEHPDGERVWVPPGGTVLAKDDKDLYETVLDSLYREWREETGMDITQDELRMELPEEELVYWQSGDRSIKFVAEGRAPDSLLQELPEQEEWAGIGDVLRVAWRDRDDCSFLCDQSSS